MDTTSSVTVVIVHGWTCKDHPLVKLEQQLRDVGFVVLSPTLPGFGETLIPPQDWGVYEYAQWLRDFITKNSQKPVVLVGHSFGGAVSAVCAAQYPSIISHLVVVNPSGVRRKSIYTDIKKKLASFGSRFFSLPGISVTKPLFSKIWTRGTGSYDYAEAPQELKPILARILSQDIRRDLSRIRSLVLIMWAQNDTATPIAMSTIWKDNIPSATFVTVPGEGHSFLYERPEIVVKHVQDFMRNT